MNILIIEDYEPDYLMIREELFSYPGFDFELKRARDMSQALEIFNQENFDVIISDLGLKDSQGLDTFLLLKDKMPDVPIIVLSGLNDEYIALEAVKLGAQDYLVKGEISGPLLVRAIKYAIERKKSEIKLLESEKQYRQLVNNAPIGVYKTNLEGNIVFCNEAFMKVLGVERREDIENIDISDFYKDSSRRDLFLDILENRGKVDNFDLELISKDGKEKNILTSAFYETGVISGMAIDISRQTKALKDLKDSEEKQKAILNAIPDNMFLVDSEFIFRDYFISDSTLLYEQPKDFIGKNVKDVLPGNVSDNLIGLMKAASDSGKTQSGEYKLEIKGVEKHFEARINAFQKDLFIAIIRDVTEEKSLEKQVVESQKMNAIGKLAGGVAHEFNNIMTAIINYAEIIRIYEKKDKPDFDEIFNYIRKISKSARTAADLSSQLLAFGRRQINRPETLSLNAVLESMQDMLERSLPENIQFEITTEHDIGLINFDKHQLQQVIMNLVLNAKDFMPDGGTLSIATEQVSIEDDKDSKSEDSYLGKFIKLSVKDSGLGIKDSIKDRIFEPFFTTKSVGEGIGLGLSVVYGILRQNKSWIEVKSKPLEGATFEIYIPTIEKKQQEIMEETYDTKFRAKGEKVLVIEDEESVLYSTSLFMEKLGFKVLTAGSGKEALEIFNRENSEFDLIFADIVLPDFYSIDLIETMKRVNPNIKVLFFSGYDSVDIDRLKKKKKNVAFLRKPFAINSVINTLEDLLYKQDEEG